jgi:hypothetical protein
MNQIPARYHLFGGLTESGSRSLRETQVGAGVAPQATYTGVHPREPERAERVTGPSAGHRPPNLIQLVLAKEEDMSAVTPASTTTRGPAAEAPITLTERAPRTLGLLDQLGFWGNLGVSLLGFAGALSILVPVGVAPLTFPAAVTAIVVGTLLGGTVLATSLVLGTRTGAPAMVLLRGLLGARASVVPTVVNLAQCLGWAVFELVVIGEGLRTVTGGRVPRWACVLVAGLVTIAFAYRPLGAIRVIRTYVSVLVVVAMAVLAFGLLRHPLSPPPARGAASGWPSTPPSRSRSPGCRSAPTTPGTPARYGRRSPAAWSASG